jgi:hypothetical protein
MAKNRYEPVEQPVEDAAEVVPYETVDASAVDSEPAAKPKRTILVLRHYQGRRSNEQVIFPKAYYDDDPELYGLADYLLENGYARLG